MTIADEMQAWSRASVATLEADQAIASIHSAIDRARTALRVAEQAGANVHRQKQELARLVETLRLMADDSVGVARFAADYAVPRAYGT